MKLIFFLLLRDNIFTTQRTNKFCKELKKSIPNSEIFYRRGLDLKGLLHITSHLSWCNKDMHYYYYLLASYSSLAFYCS